MRAPIAAEGAAPVRAAPLPPWPVFADDEVGAAVKVLASGRVNYWTGEEGRRFEEEFARYCGRRYAISLANGTVALELALHALGIGPGDEVVVPARTFIATASCVVARGATPVVADVDGDSGNMTSETLRAVLTPRTRAVIPVHLAGWPCDMAPLLALAAERGLHVVEDCAQAHGAEYRGAKVGSFGICSAFSFCQDKIMTTGGEGGMFLTDDEAVWRRAWAYKDHGKSWQAVHEREHAPGFRWLHESFGTNWRMTEVQAAIGRVQLRKLPTWLASRRRNARRLTEALAGVPGLRIPAQATGFDHACYKFYAFLEPEALSAGWNQARIIEAINREGIPCQSGSCCEIYRERAFSDLGLGPAAPLPAARRLGETSLMLPVHPTLTEADIDDSALAVRKVLGAAVHG